MLLGKYLLMVNSQSKTDKPNHARSFKSSAAATYANITLVNASQVAKPNVIRVGNILCPPGDGFRCSVE